MRTVLVTGVQGVGKSTITRLAAQTLGLEDWDYAELMLRVEPTISSKDDLRFIGWDDRVQVYRKVDKLLAELFWPGDGRDVCVLLENHLSILDDESVRTFPHEHIRRYNPLGLVVIEAPPYDVLIRRRTDQQRDRHIGSLAEVTKQQQVNQREAFGIGELIGIPITVIANDQKEETAQQLAQFVRRVLG